MGICNVLNKVCWKLKIDRIYFTHYNNLSKLECVWCDYKKGWLLHIELWNNHGSLDILVDCKNNGTYIFNWKSIRFYRTVIIAILGIKI